MSILVISIIAMRVRARLLFLLVFIGMMAVSVCADAQVAAFSCTPSIDFGTVPMGSYALRNILCTNVQGTPTAFSYGATVGLADFETNPCVGGLCYDTFPAVIPPGDTFGIAVAFHPTALGLRSGSQTIFNNAGLANSVIGFSGNGAAPIPTAPIPMLGGPGFLILAAGLILAAMYVLFKPGG